MEHTQVDLFAQDTAERNKLPELRRASIRARLEAVIANLQATTVFPWKDPLDAVHQENRFQRDVDLLCDDGSELWARFDREMERLYATQTQPEVGAAE